MTQKEKKNYKQEEKLYASSVRLSVYSELCNYDCKYHFCFIQGNRLKFYFHKVLNSKFDNNFVKKNKNKIFSLIFSCQYKI